MPGILIACPGCGQELEAPKELAGQLVECPACQQTMTVPEEVVSVDQVKPEDVHFSMPGLETAGGADKPCPGCGVDMAADAVLCVNCGFHTGLGKKMTTDLS